MSYRLSCIAATLGAVLCAGTQAGATTINVTTDGNTWVSSQYITGSHTLVDFSGITSISTYPSGFSKDDFEITAMQGSTDKLQAAYTSSGGTLGLEGISAGSLLVQTPTGGENALYLGIGTSGSGLLTLKFTFADGTTATYTQTDGLPPAGGSGWFGISASEEISSIALSSSATSPILTALYFASSSLPQDQTQSPTPEASTLLLTCGGLLILFGSGRALIYKNIV